MVETKGPKKVYLKDSSDGVGNSIFGPSESPYQTNYLEGLSNRIPVERINCLEVDVDRNNKLDDFFSATFYAVLNSGERVRIHQTPGKDNYGALMGSEVLGENDNFLVELEDELFYNHTVLSVFEFVHEFVDGEK